MGFSRRNFLKSAGTGAMGAALGLKLTYAALPVDAQSTSPAAAFYTTTLGDFTITVIRDGVTSIGLDRLAANADPAEVEALLASNGFPTGEQPNNFKPMLINTGSDLVLIDTGLGSPTSQLIPTLQMIGVEPDDIGTVLLTHWHPDHINGVAMDGSPTFPNATYMISQTEWDVLNAPDANQGLQGALTTLQPVVDMLDFYNDGDAVLPGIEALATPGHTPGHHGFVISSGDQTLINVADAIVNPVISVQRPDWYFGFDAAPDQAVSTRQSLLERLSTENARIFSYHFPFPGLGYIGTGAEENSYRFNAFSY